MKRKILSLILVFAMTVSLLTVGTGAVEPTYGDTAGHWAESSIERWSGHGIIQGSNGQFDPNGQLTCAQLATILAKLLKLPAAKDAGFTDNTADAWYYDAINRCAAAGILNGNGDGTVTPEAPITRERAMVMLARALGIEPIRKPDLTKYTDAAQVSAYAQGYVAALIEAGIVGGVTADELAPQDNINRASTVTILDRAISTYADKAGETVKVDGKGLVLVVAENVKITGAPEGTKIVVADGATGLTVNGKSVSDDQTYIVPKTTTGSGSSSGGYSHTHNWKDNYCAGCGQFKDTVVAVIGKKGYLTLKEAVTAATNGQTVKLVKDVELSEQFAIDKAITLDLGSHTLKSTWLMSGGQRYAIISNAPLTIQNGTVAVGQARAITAHDNLILDSVTVTQELTGDDACIAFSGAGKAYLITNSTIKGAYAVCNFANNATITISGSELIGTGNVLYHNGNNCGLNLTVIDTKITGTGDGCGVYLSGSTETLGAGGLQKATFKNCTITGTNGVETKYTNLTMENCIVTATGTPSFEQNNNGPATSGFAVVSTDNTMSPNTPAPDGKTTITGNKGSYTGLIGLRTFPGILNTYPDMKESTYAIAGGTFDHNPDAQYIAAGYEAKNNGNGTWTVSEKTGVTLVAQVGVNKYASLADALAAVQDGDTVKLVSDITTNTTIEVTGNKTITIDLAEKKITSTADAAIVNNGTGKLTITGNGTVDTSSSTNGENIAIWARTGSIDIENGTFINKSNKEATVYAGTSADASTPVITIKGGTFENKATGPYEYKNSLKPLTLNVENSKPVTSIVITGGTFYGNDPKNGDDNKGGTFLAPDYKSVETSAGVWTVEKKDWKTDYKADGSEMPSGVVITTARDPAGTNGSLTTVTLKDQDAYLYFTQVFDHGQAYNARKQLLTNDASKKYEWENHGADCNIWYTGYIYKLTVKLDCDIDLKNATVDPFLFNDIGNTYFTFDGNNHTISNANLASSTGNVGLFGKGVSVKNLTLDNIHVTATGNPKNQSAGIVSCNTNTDIDHVTVRNSSVTGGKYTGAIVGYNYGSVTNCKVQNCTVSGQYKVGGIIGYICNSNDVHTSVTGNSLTNVAVKAENVLTGKTAVIGKIVGNWDATIGECSDNTFSGTTDATGDIGEIESRCTNVIVNGKLASKASGTTLREIVNSKPESPVEITLAEGESPVEVKDITVPEGYILYKKDTDDSKTYQLMKNEGNVEVSLQELQNLKITKGPKAADAKATTFTVGLVDQKIKAGDISYSEHNSGYTGKGVLIGGTTMNSYGVSPANDGNYKFVIKGGTITSAATGYSSIDGYKDASVYMLVPSNSDVTFEDVTFEGVLSFDIQKYTSPWSNLNSLTFKNCIFKGIIIGTCPASNVTFDGCKFENYTNSTKPNNSNPIWWREDTEGSGDNANPIKTFTFVNNEVVGTRPLKIERIGKTVSPAFTFKNNTFDISKRDGDTGTKNMAINIGMGENPNLPFTLIDEGNTISANTAALYTVAFSGSNSYKAVSGMKVLDGHENAKTITAMVWKTTTGETFNLQSVD
ncbi:S-layer homology domain-containing protein [Oscillibacter sp. MSJ-31]|uniref:S-layer homology domain-containing protein n=1 Tax=Oscillibacter sp. MSJ-31 TaxID=2841526 RepID=UPI001C0F58B9|nr:S-layer homology domain-containing protein [Oscillibacter sp. MSJ-31]MBU5458742.1 S-layer homology domain-containing protein [Oscillibacter sp. MSJ-31]